MQWFSILLLAATTAATPAATATDCCTPTLRALHPDEPASVTLNVRFGARNALERLEQVRAALDDYTSLTQSLKADAGRAASTHALPGWEETHLGYPNWTGAIEGALRAQTMEIARLRHELARERHARGSASGDEVARAREACEQATRAFEEFWNEAGIAD